MISVLKGHIVEARALGELSIAENGLLVLDDGVIVGVYATLPERYRGARVTDYGDRLIMQSFCDMHLHAPQYPMLGTGMDLPLLEWLQNYAFPTEARFSDTEYARSVYRELAAALISHGTTRACVFSSLHRPATLILMEELERAGVSGYVGKVNMDQNGGARLEEGTEESKRETLRWLDECGRFTTVKPILTPRFTPSCSGKLMAWLGGLAKERGLYVQSHLSENLDEIAWVRRLHPDCAQYWQSYDKYGLFNSHTLMAHCVYSDAAEQEAMRAHHVMAVHCPDSNINICSGLAPLREMLERGVWVGLGSDIAGGAQLSMMQVMTACIRMSKALRIDTDWQTPFITVKEAYYLGSSAGARYFGAGAGFAPGDKLHAIVLDDSDFPPAQALSVEERFERAIYLGGARNIVAVYSEGKAVKGAS